MHCVAFSRDGSGIISGSFDKTIKVWDTEKGTLLRTLEGEAWFCKCATSPDGKHIAVSDHLGLLHLLEWVRYEE